MSTSNVRVAMPMVVDYTMAKAAVEAMTRTLAQHLGHRRITVNAVSPGPTETDMMAFLASMPEVRDTLAGLSAMGRMGQPGDIAAVVAFLASEDAGWITGQTLDASGQEWADAVRTVAAGGRVLPPELAVAAMEATVSPLTQRETEVLRLAATGAGPAEIATKLFITYGTARNHLTAAVAKLHARNRVDAVRIATEQGWL